MQYLRHFLQTVILIIVVSLTYRNASGLTKCTVETFCPAGGLEGLPFYFANKSFLCATSGINLILLIVFLILTLLVARAFCSWICPIGTVCELMKKISDKLGISRKKIWDSPFRHLSILKYFVLIAVLYFSYKATDLIFRPFCPYYVIFSWQTHEVMWWSKWLMVSLISLTMIVPFFWCKILCPFGAFLILIRKFSPFALSDISSNCDNCSKCAENCPQSIDLKKSDFSRTSDCTTCLSCINKQCPNHIKPEIKIPFLPKTALKAIHIPTSVVPVLVIVFFSIGVGISLNFQLPTIRIDYVKTPDSTCKINTMNAIVKGVRCRGMANTLSSEMISKIPGILSMEAYAGEQRVIISFDSNKTDIEKITNIINSGTESTDKKTGKKSRKYPFKVEKVE
ncbi:MAG: 4Fe-4S binding protein [Candidatus Riflebacteria bacterium]|nr:4Fe-4S binding protein [Candidatus Riflebacteria bacterium]